MSKDRENIIDFIDQAIQSGARQSRACEIIGISAKTLQRWHHPDNTQDGRQTAQHHPLNKLTEVERQRIIKIANEPAYADLAPHKIVPKLADQGLYIASESSFYRVLKAEKQLQHRQKSKPIKRVNKPKALTATGPNQLYSWDITYRAPNLRKCH